MWNYALTFKPTNDALDTKSDVVVLGNKNARDNLRGVWTLNYNLNFPDQKNTIIYAEVIGYVGVVTGLSVTVTFNNVEDTSSRNVSIILTEEVQGELPSIFTISKNTFVRIYRNSLNIKNRIGLVLGHF